MAELLDSDAGSDVEVVLTPAQLICSLEEAWMNEKFAPELLESKTEIVECVMEQLEHMEENLKRTKQGDLKISIHRMEVERIRYVLSSYLRCRLRKIEKYFPHVLEKEKTRAEGEPSILSPEEFAFAKEYTANTENHFKNVALRHMPPNLQKVEFLKAVPKPNLDAFVFLRVKERQENIMVEPEHDDRCKAFLKASAADNRALDQSRALSSATEAFRKALPAAEENGPVRQCWGVQGLATTVRRDYVIDLDENSQHLIRYKTIAPLVASGAVQLI